MSANKLRQRVEVGRVKPKHAKLIELLNTARALKRRIKAVPDMHHKLVIQRMRRAAVARYREESIVGRDRT